MVLTERRKSLKTWKLRDHIFKVIEDCRLRYLC